LKTPGVRRMICGSSTPLGDRAQRLIEPGPIGVDLPKAEACDQVSEGAQHQVAVLDHVGDAGWCARVVLEHQEAAVVVAHDVDAADLDIGAVRQVVADHLAAEVAVAEHEVGRHDAIVENLLVMIDVVEELVDRRDPLHDTGLDGPPVGSGQYLLL
jgi:hypothetical protein